jgi:glucose-1-phosphate adenylyltransferase
MALLEDEPELDLYDKDWIVHTRSEERAPAKVGSTAQIHRSLISHGCVIEGMVVNSVLSPGVRVGVGAVVRDSIVMFDSIIRPGAVVDRSILDKEVVVGQGAIVGDGPFPDKPNKDEPTRLNTGITVVGKHAIIPRGARIGRNVRIAADVRSSDYVGRVVHSGGSVNPKPGTGRGRDDRPADREQDRPTPARAGVARGKGRPIDD